MLSLHDDRPIFNVVEQRHFSDAFRQWVAHRPKNLPNAIHNVRRQLLVIKTRGVFFLAIMKLAYGFHTNSCLLQAVPPARRSSVISDGVVPTTMLMYITAGGDAGTGRHAYW